jgi:hypothetical protein
MLGSELMQRKPPRMNAPYEVIRELLNLSSAREVIEIQPSPVSTRQERVT